MSFQSYFKIAGLSCLGMLFTLGCESSLNITSATQEQQSLPKTVAAADPLPSGGFSSYTNGYHTNGPRPTFYAPGGFGLAGFRFNFKNQGRHLKQIEATLYGENFGGSGYKNNWITVYKDINDNCPYWGDLNYQTLPNGTKHGYKVLENEGFDDYITLGEAVPGTVPVLTGFTLADKRTDFHPVWITVWLFTENDPSERIVFGRAINYYDPKYVKAYFHFSGSGSGQGYRRVGISYAMVPKNKIKSSNNYIYDMYWSQKEKSGSVPNAQRAVLQGFSLALEEDTHIDRIGVQVGNNGWRVTADDGDMWANFVVKWAEVMP